MGTHYRRTLTNNQIYSNEILGNQGILWVLLFPIMLFMQVSIIGTLVGISLYILTLILRGCWIARKRIKKNDRVEDVYVMVGD